MQLASVLRKASEIGVGLTAIATLILAGCGGGGSSSGGSAGAGANMTTLSISPSLGRFKEGSRVRIKDKNGFEIGYGTTNASGVASVEVLTSSAAPLLVETGFTNDQYFDEKTGQYVAISGITGVGIRALIPDHTAASQVGVTALTEIAVGSLVDASGVVNAGVTAASAVGANATVAQSFGVTDLLTPPKLVGSRNDINALGNAEADKYALKLAALANMAGAGEDALKVAHRLRNDLNLATPASGIAATITAMKAFMVSMPSAPAGATTIANAVVVPHANAKLVDMIPAAMNAAATQLAALDTALTKAQIIAAINTAAANNASGVMAAIATGQVPASAIQAALQQAQQQAAAAIPTVTGFSPASGVAGTTVNIAGTGFDPFFQHNTVKFNGTLATVTAGTTTSLTVTVPAGATTGAISVTNTMSQLANKTGTSSGSFTLNTGSNGTTGGTVPAAPTVSAPVVVDSANINLGWPAVSGATSYNVYRSTSPSVAITPANRVATSYVSIVFMDTGLSAATTYYYKVTAINAAGEGAGSIEVSAITNAGAGANTSAPTSLTATVASNTQVNLSWNAVPGATQYIVSRSTTPGMAALLASNAVSMTAATTANITGLSAATTYYFAVQSTTPGSVASAEVSATTTGGIVPAAPTGVTAVPTSATQIDLNWTAVTGATGYNVYQATAAGVVIAAANKINATAITTNAFNITSLIANTPYFYKITAVNGSGESLASFEVTATPGNGIVTTLAGTAGLLGNADNTGIAARFNMPQGIATDAAGNLYVADTGNSLIRKITPSGVVSTLAGGGGAWLVGAPDGIGLEARFNQPGGMTVDSAGNLYVADTGNNTIRKITPAGVVTTLAGGPSFAGGASSAGYADGIGRAALFNAPRGITADSAGNLYVADTGSHTIRKITPAGEVTTLAGSAGRLGSADGMGTAARFSSPIAITADAAGNLYVADFGNHTIRKITPAGEVSTLAGNAGVVGSADGTGIAAQFKMPQGIAADSAGNLYVADSGNSTIRMITPAGVVTTLAGKANFNGSKDGTGTAARLYTPVGITADTAGNLYVTDSMSMTIRKIH